MAKQLAAGNQLLVADHLGSVRDVTDASAGLVARFDFDPWGRRTRVGGTGNTAAGFTDHSMVELPGSTLVMAPYRLYDPALARWLSPDPSGIQSDVNLFRYVINNPILLVDPTGLVAELHCERIEREAQFRGYKFKFKIPARHCYINVQCKDIDRTLEMWGPGEGGRPGYGRPQGEAPTSTERNRGAGWSAEILPGIGETNCCAFEKRLVDCYNKLKDEIPPYVSTGPNSNTFAASIVKCARGYTRFPMSATGAQ